jgi:5-methylcytosine-specific restriction endonuclease McrA
MENSTCPACGERFYRYPSQIAAGVRITCSRTCAGQFRRKGSMQVCETCGIEFYRRKSLADKGYGRFCSHACELKSRNRNGPLNCICQQCGTSFVKDHWSVSLGGGKFCSRACIDRFKRKLRKRGEKEMFTNWQKREWKDAKCAKCGATSGLELDHIIARFAGGKAIRDNAQTLCRRCNRRKFWEEDYPLYESLLKQRVECA